MFDKIKEIIRVEVKKYPSSYWKIRSITYLVSWIIELIMCIICSIYIFCNYADTEFWWAGFFPLLVALFCSLINGFCIKLTNKRYRLALYYEKEKKKEEEKKNEIKNS